jgi:hypothetical protein
VTLVANYIPFEEPAGGPNFHHFGDDVLYDINLDNNGDAIPDVTYEFRFRTAIQNKGTFLYNTGPIDSINSPNYNYRQLYTVARIDKGHRTVLGVDLPTAPANIGPRSIPNYAGLANEAIRPLEGGSTKVFAGPRDDPFFVDLGSAFDLLGLRPLNGAHVIQRPGAQDKAGVDGVSGYNVHSIALQVPITRLTSDGRGLSGKDDPRAVVGVWASASRQSTRVLNAKGGSPRNSGRYVQVSRLGAPLVNEVVIPLGAKDLWNSSQPKDDAQFLAGVQDPEPARLIPALYKGALNVPPTPRNDLVTIFLTGIPGINQPPHVKPSEELRLNMAIPPSANPNRLGILARDANGKPAPDAAGFPNGRRLTDDVTDIELQALAGATPLNPTFDCCNNANLTDGVDKNDVPFLSSFPYLAYPHEGYSSPLHRAAG